MNSEETRQEILDFFETIEKYYGCKTEITEGLCKSSSFNPDFSTWNLFEFHLIRSAYRTQGDRFMLEGNGMYYEMDAGSIVALTKTGRNKFEFIEQLGDTIFRITKIRFHYKY
ncbi:hypothetical protein [Flavobacterium luminosum]|uniref:AraC family transcriptional regulator n=1 Tax=Flavobacterium luminosum TaxID=2949086 RepID=A0ABT0TJY9_9FLAO|nr:hypothetical protein [Flavobacterium sp. HXWNR70]MCL9807800.1 hypothetical protein [Flavobacterium sp. HXWNR70]